MNRELIINDIKQNNLEKYTLEDVNHTFDFLDYIVYDDLHSDIFMGKFDINNRELIKEIIDLIKEYSVLFSLEFKDKDYITISLIIYNISRRIRKSFLEEIEPEEIIKRLDNQEMKRRILRGSLLLLDTESYDHLYNGVQDVLNSLTSEPSTYRVIEAVNQIIDYTSVNLNKVIDHILEYCKKVDKRLYHQITTGTLNTSDDRQLMKIVKLVDDYNKEKKTGYEDDDLVAFSYGVRMLVEENKDRG